jgi:thiol-disulfide isomerase/thioredoxin
MTPQSDREKPRRAASMRAVAWTAIALLFAAAIGATVVYRRGSADDAFYAQWGVDRAHLPYTPTADAHRDIADAKARAAANGKMVMVTFGANWCPDCLTLHKDLEDPVAREYADKKFERVNVDVGEFDKNADVARELGVAPVNGIPLAVFFSSDGRPICDTRRGELEPSRHYTSSEILDFLKEVVDHRRVVNPDQRQ